MELKFLEALVKELEEKHRIELRKKAILAAYGKVEGSLSSLCAALCCARV